MKNSVEEFIIDRCVIGDDCWDSSSVLFAAYLRWSKADDRDVPEISHRQFIQNLRKEVEAIGETFNIGWGRGRRAIIGLCLRENEGQVRFKSSQKILELEEKQNDLI